MFWHVPLIAVQRIFFAITNTMSVLFNIVYREVNRLTSRRQSAFITGVNAAW